MASAKMKSESIEKDYDIEQSNPKFVNQMLATNWTNLLADMFTPLVKRVTPYLHSLADTLGRIDAVVRLNPGRAFAISLGVVTSGLVLAGVTAARSIGWVRGLTGSIGGFGTSAAIAANEIAAAAERIRLASLGAAVPGIGANVPVVAGSPSARRSGPLSKQRRSPQPREPRPAAAAS
jgi:hypothetical protein